MADFKDRIDSSTSSLSGPSALRMTSFTQPESVPYSIHHRRFNEAPLWSTEMASNILHYSCLQKLACTLGSGADLSTLVPEGNVTFRKRVLDSTRSH